MKTKYFTNLNSHAMKNSTLKVALVAVATIMGLNGFAQTNTGSAQWTVQTTVNDYVSTAGNKVTVGKTMPFWVWPSAAYNPDFDYTAIPTFATEAQISNNVLSTFAWSATGTAPVVTTTNDNYVTIQWPVADIGAQTISVTETPASGVCPATPVTFAVTVIGAPDFTITTGASTFGLTNEITHACWSAVGDNQTAIPFVNNNASEVYPFDFYLDYKIYTVNGLDGSGHLPAIGGNFDSGASGVTPVLYDSKVNGVAVGVPNQTTNPIKVTAGLDLLPAAVDFGVVGGKITVYEFDLSGYNGKVSRTSDYLALTAGNVGNYGTYSQYGTAAKYYIIALPAPVTGPIYHIANTFGL